MKLEERNKALQLRHQGFSIKQIADNLNVSKGSVSAWVREISLPPELLESIENRKILGRELSRLTRLSNIAQAHKEISAQCKEEVLPFSKRDLWIAGLMIYAGEGNKTLRVSNQHVEVTNSDHSILRLFINFLIKICGVSKDKIRIRLMLYEDIKIEEAEEYWAQALCVPLNQFQKPFIKLSYKELPHRHLRRAEYGTAHIIVYDIRLYRKIIGWLQAIYEHNNLDFIK